MRKDIWLRKSRVENSGHILYPGGREYDQPQEEVGYDGTPQPQMNPHASQISSADC